MSDRTKATKFTSLNLKVFCKLESDCISYIFFN